MRRRVLLVAYPLLPVTEASAGGAEQILWTLERELARRGWETTVAACAGSQVSGELLVTGTAPRGVADESFAERRQEHEDRVVQACAGHGFELVLDHSGHFFTRAGSVDEPVLATLHLPREMYREQGREPFEHLAPNVSLHCVSRSQLAEFEGLPGLGGVVRNGIALERFRPRVHKGEFLLWLGRVCPEKAPHLAIEAARKAGRPIVLAGQVYPFRWHQEYWEREVQPHIEGDHVRWVSSPDFECKAELLRDARALLVSSQVAETTSLVALEAMASGTPVIAFDRGALREVVTPETGFLVSSVDGMAKACRRVVLIDPSTCRHRVEKEYSAETMADGYEARMERALNRSIKRYF